MHRLENPEIVIVEDDKNDAQLVIRTLTKNNLANNILHLKDGEEALDYFFARGPFEGRETLNLPKVILLDLKMPKVDGLEVLKQLKQSELTKAIPVVMMTSSRQERDIIETYKLGVSSFVVKPVEFSSFIKAVNELGMYWLLINQPPIIKPASNETH